MRRWLGILLIVLTFFTFSGNLHAQSQSLVGFSIYNPIQIPDEDHSIEVIRFNAFYGVHRDLTGLDMGVISPVTLNIIRRDLKGIQFGFYNQVGRDGLGLQWGIMNYVRNDFTGIQYALGNITGGRHRGIQFGFLNRADTIKGVQLGVFNYAAHLHGVQVGLSNLRSSATRDSAYSAPYRFFPIVNWAF